MIDGIRAYLNERDGQHLRAHPLLTWRPKGLNRQGHPTYEASWKGFLFKADETRCTQLRGSLHKYFHDGKNWTDFTREQVGEAIVRLCHSLGLHPNRFKLGNVEVAVNIEPPSTALEVLAAIVLHKTSAATPQHSGRSLLIEHDAFQFKIYDKGQHCRLSRELLRVEVSVNKMRAVAGSRSWTLADLLHQGTWDALSAYLGRRCDELLIAEFIPPPAELSPADVQLWVNAGSSAYWLGLTKQRRSERRKRLTCLYETYVPNPVKAAMCASVQAKLSELNTPCPTDVYTDGATDLTYDLPRTFTPVGNLPDGIQEESVRTTTHLVINGVEVLHPVPPPGEPRVCHTCGKDIGHQRPDSKYCSETFSGRDGKSCRNRASNATRGLRKLEQKGPSLFDPHPYLRGSLGLPRRRAPGPNPDP